MTAGRAAGAAATGASLEELASELTSPHRRPISPLWAPFRAPFSFSRHLFDSPDRDRSYSPRFCMSRLPVAWLTFGDPMRWMSGLCALFLSASVAGADEHHDHKLSAEELGSIHFAISCSKSTRTEFNRAVALLHSFQYEQSRASFVEVSKRDPTCSMAQWGIAIIHYHGLWY